MTWSRRTPSNFTWTILAWIVGPGHLVIAAEPPANPEPTSVQLASTVLLYGRQSVGTLQATGIVVDAEAGWVVTAWHFWSTVENPGLLTPIYEQGKLTLAPSPYLNHYLQGKAARPRLVWYDVSRDLALIEVSNQPIGKPVALSRALLTQGDPVLALGNPMSRNAMWQLEPGRVTERQWREWTYLSGQRIGAELFAFTVNEPLSTGYSGGPVFNAKGEVAGMIIAAAKPDGSSVYAVEANAIDRFLARSNGHLALQKTAEGNLDAAKRHANLAVAYASTDPWGYVVRGHLRLSQGRSADGVEDFQSAWRAMPLARVLNRWNQSLKTIRNGAAGLNRDEPRTVSGN